MPPLGPKDGEKREGDDSVWRRACGVGGTISEMLQESERSNPGVRMVRLAGFRRMLFDGAMAGDGGAER